jgi:hypothetical protein
MLVSFSTQCSRAKRKKAGLFLLPVAALEQAAAAVRAAETQEQGITLIVNATQPLLYGLDVFMSTLLILGRASTAPVTVGVYCGPTHVAAEQALDAGAQLLIPEQRHSREQFVSLLSWCAARAQAQGSEVAVAPATDESLPALFQLLQAVPLCALLLPVERIKGAPEGVKVVVHEVTQLTKLPLILECTEDHTPTELRRYVKSGVNGILISEEFDQAFTAGVRTALRDRETSDPAVYLSKGGRAVEDKAIRYLQTLCST